MRTCTTCITLNLQATRLCSVTSLVALLLGGLQLGEGRLLQDPAGSTGTTSRLSYSNLYEEDQLHQHIPGALPVCSHAYASIHKPGQPDDRSMWGRYLQVSIAGVSDPSGQHVVIAIDSILQNEPAYNQHSQDACPDAQVNGLNSLFLRFENGEAGLKDGTRFLQQGRTYYVGFTARDEAGLSCTGTVTACVPFAGHEECVATSNDRLFDSRTCSPNIDLFQPA